MFNKLKNKKILEAEKLERKFENLKNRRLVKERIDALRKKLNELNKARRNKASSSETSSDIEISTGSENNGDDTNVINLDDINLSNLSSDLNMTPEIVEELSNYFLKMANKKRKKDSENNGDDDYDINPNIKINMENILDDDSITPEYLEELSKSYFKQANEMRSKDNEDDSENNGNNATEMRSKDNEDDSENNRNNGNNIENINTNPKRGSGMFTSQEFAKLLTFLAQLHAGNNSKKLKNDINQLLKSLYNSKQINELVYENLIAAI